MAFLIDTCVLSEPTRKSPDARVLRFLDNLDLADAYMSVISVAEIWKGICKLPPSRRRTQYEEWLNKTLLPGFTNPPLPVDINVAWKWGELRAALDARGNKVPAVDCILAATALVHDLTVVTRNDWDFTPSGVKILNPWH
jgi:predicted nucleic acid-binding protein